MSRPTAVPLLFRTQAHQTCQALASSMSSFSVFRQKVKEKFGTNRGERSDLPETAEQSRSSDCFREGLRKSEKSFQKFSKSIKVVSEAGRDFSDAAHDLHIEAKVALQRNMLAGCLDRVIDVQKYFDLQNMALSHKFEEQITLRFGKMVDEELRLAKDQQAKYDSVRLAYDAAVNDLNNAQKNKSAKPEAIQKLEKTLSIAKQNWETVGQETAEILSDINGIVECELIEAMCDFVDAYTTYFQSAARFLNEMVPAVYSYRRFLQEGRETRYSALTQEPADISKQKKSFGVPLAEICARDGSDVPLFLDLALDWLVANGLEQEGIFRLSPALADVISLKATVDQTGILALKPDVDPHAVAALVKSFFRELPEPVLTFKLYESFIETNNIRDAAIKIPQLQALLATLPACNRQTIGALLGFAHYLSKKEAINKMSPGNLATCFAPNIISPEVLDPVTFDPFEPRAVIEYMIEHFPAVFGEDEPRAKSPIRVAPPTVARPPPPKKAPSIGKLSAAVVRSPASAPASPAGSITSPRTKDDSQIEADRPKPPVPNRPSSTLSATSGKALLASLKKAPPTLPPKESPTLATMFAPPSPSGAPPAPPTQSD